MKATIQERGNGFPSVGDYAPGDDGNLYRIVALSGRIQTAQSSNYIYAEVESADWLDCPEEDEFPALVVLGEDEDSEENH